MNGCIPCGRDLHEECLERFMSPNPQPGEPPEVITLWEDTPCCCQGNVSATIEKVTGKAGRPMKDNAILTDVYSTWRKRASAEYPLDREADCDWKGKADVGGGKYPIVGCANGKQATIHHGPVKIDPDFQFNFNEANNIHRICERCHHLWHHWNDAPYDSALWATMPNVPRDALPNELLQWSNATTRPKAPEPRTKPISKDAD